MSSVANNGSALSPLPIRVRVAGGRTVEGKLHVAPGESLMDAIRLRGHFLNLTNARWIGPDDNAGKPLTHVAIRLQHVVWLTPVSEALPLTNKEVLPTESRMVQLELMGGQRLTVSVRISVEQRVSDYFESNPGFVPLHRVRDERSGGTLEGVALNGDAILAIRETGPAGYQARENASEEPALQGSDA